MYKIIKDVLENGEFELNDILHKINKVWIEAEITEEEKTELDSLAREKANINNSIDVLNKLKEMDLRILNCENEIATLKGTQEEPEEPETEEYPEFIKDYWYYKGDKITFNNKKYICIAPEGQVCVWSPSEYPVYWQEVVDSTENSTENAENSAEVVTENETEESEG